MATHLEYVIGPLGELTVLPCACGRVSDHPRLSSTVVVPVPPVVHRSAAHSSGHRRRGVALRPRAMARGRHAA